MQQSFTDTLLHTLRLELPFLDVRQQIRDLLRYALQRFFLHPRQFQIRVQRLLDASVDLCQLLPVPPNTRRPF